MAETMGYKPEIFSDGPKESGQSRGEILARLQRKKDERRRAATVTHFDGENTDKSVKINGNESDLSSETLPKKIEEKGEKDFGEIVRELGERFNGANGVFSVQELVATGRSREEHIKLVRELLEEVHLAKEQAKTGGKADMPEYFRLKRLENKLQEEKTQLEYGHDSWYDSLRPSVAWAQSFDESEKQERAIKLDEEIKKRIAVELERRVEEVRVAEEEKAKQEEVAQAADEFVAEAIEQLSELAPEPQNEEVKTEIMPEKPAEKTPEELARERQEEKKKQLEAEVREISEQMRQFGDLRNLNSEQHDLVLGLSKRRREALKKRTELVHGMRVEGT